MPIFVEMNGQAQALTPAVAIGAPWNPSECVASIGTGTTSRSSDTVTVPLIRIAHGRSGDKGDNSNIGIIARSLAAWQWLRENLSTENVAAHMGHRIKGEVERFELPGIMALNFVLRRALGGGGMASLQSDPLGKCYAQMLLEMPIAVPREFVPE